MNEAVRRRRAQAAASLLDDPRRAQIEWQDLAAWPDWAALDDAGRRRLALLAGAAAQAATWQRCIDGALLQRLNALVGEPALRTLLAVALEAPEPAGSDLPTVDRLEEQLLNLGRDMLLASVPSAVLRVSLRERFWPLSLPRLPALDAPHARRIVAWLADLDALPVAP